MVQDTQPGRFSNVQGFDLNFMARKHGVHLQHFNSQAVFFHRELLRVYRVVLDRNETLARHFDVPLVSDMLEETLSKAFSSRNPSLAQSSTAEYRDTPPSWVDVIQNVDPKQLELNADGTHFCRVQGALIRLSNSDCTVIQSGVLQKLVDSWPHPKDIQAELDTVASTITGLSVWNQCALDALHENRLLLEDLGKRSDMLRNAAQRDSMPEHQSPSHESTGDSNLFLRDILNATRRDSISEHQSHSRESITASTLFPLSEGNNEQDPNTRERSDHINQQENSVLEPRDRGHEDYEMSQVLRGDSDATSTHLKTHTSARPSLQDILNAARQDSIPAHQSPRARSGILHTNPQESSELRDRGHDDYEMSQVLRGDSDLRSPNPKTHTSERHRWSREEEIRLLPFLDAFKHLTGPEIEQEYFQLSGKYRRSSALEARARRLGHNCLRSAKKTQTRRGRAANKFSLPSQQCTELPDNQDARPTATPRLTGTLPIPREHTTEIHAQSNTSSDNTPVQCAEGRLDHSSSMLSRVNLGHTSRANGERLGCEVPLSLDSLLH